MNKNILKYFGLAALLALGVQTVAEAATIEVGCQSELTDAINSAQPTDVIKLTSDILLKPEASYKNASGCITISKDVTIDGDGHKIAVDTDGLNASISNLKGVLMVKQGTISLSNMTLPKMAFDYVVWGTMTVPCTAEPLYIQTSAAANLVLNNVNVPSGQIKCLPNNGAIVIDMVNCNVAENFGATSGDTKINIYSGSYSAAFELTCKVYGGTFKSAVPSVCIAEGSRQVANADGTYSVVPAAAAVAKVGGKEYETLADAVAAANDGDTVTIISSDLVSINGVSINKNVTIEGAGADKTVLDMGTGSMGGVASKTVTYRNLTLRYNNTGTMPYTQGVNHAMQAYDHVTIAGSIAVMDDTLFDTCTFTGALDDGTTVPEYLVWIYAHKATFSGCTFEKAGSKGSIKLYAEVGNMCATEVAGTTFKEIGSKGSAIYTSNSNNSSSTTKVVYEVVTDDASITVPEGKVIVKASGNGLSVVNPVKDANGKYIGGQFITASTDQATIESIIGNVCAEGYAPKKNDDGTWGVEVAAKNFYQDETDKSLWHVANVAGLKEFRDSVNKGTSYANCTISIDADCDLTGEGYWTAIKAYVAPNLYLTGVTINGNGHTITGMRVANPAVEDGYNYGGGFIDKAGTSLTVKDLTFVNAEVQSVSGSQVAVVVGMSYGNVTLENVDIKNSTVTADTKAGAYVGQNDDGLVTFKDCDLINTVVKANYSAALFLGLANVSSDGWDFDANCSADENSKFEWVPGKWYKEKGDLSLYGRPYCLDEDVLVLTDSGEDCWAEKRTGEVRVIDGKDVTVWGSEFYPPYVESEPEVVPEKPTAEKVEEATKVVDESGEVVTPSAQQEAAAKTEVEKVAQSFDNPEIAKVETHVAEAAMTVTGEGETQKVVVKSAIVEELQKAAPGDTAEQISSESDVKSYVKVALNEAKVAVKEEGAALKSVTFDVKPMAETTVTVGQEKTVVVAQIPNEEIEKPITFRLPLTDAFMVSAIVTHEGDPDRLCMVQGAAGGRYVEVTASHFSLFTATPSEIIETTTESKTVLGIKRVDYTVTQTTADLAAAVPWLMAAEENMPVSGLITTGISEGDQIQVYEKSANAYYTWLYRDGEWEGATGTPSADEYPLERGRAFWYKPVGGKGASGTYTQVGLYSESTITSKVDSAAVASASFANPVHFLMASPKYEDFNLKEKLTAAAGCVANDVVVIVATGKRYRFNESAWGQDLDQEVDIFGVKVSQKVFVPAEGEVIVPAGTAFWYLSAGGAPEFEW